MFYHCERLNYYILLQAISLGLPVFALLLNLRMYSNLGLNAQSGLIVNNILLDIKNVLQGLNLIEVRGGRRAYPTFKAFEEKKKKPFKFLLYKWNNFFGQRFH